jgi:hypothetical protein
MATETINRTLDTTGTTGKGKKPRKARTPKLALDTHDGNLNTKLVAEDALELARMAYKRLTQICNGKKVRKTGTADSPILTTYPLDRMSDARRKYYEDQFADLHKAAFAALEVGRKVSVAAASVPD